MGKRKIMRTYWNDAQVIDFMEKETGDIGGFVTRDEDNNLITYESYEDNGFVYGFDQLEGTNILVYFRL